MRGAGSGGLGSGKQGVEAKYATLTSKNELLNSGGKEGSEGEERVRGMKTKSERKEERQEGGEGYET